MTTYLPIPIAELSARNNQFSELDIALSHLPSLSVNGPWLCGGAIRRALLGDDPLGSDLDFFFKTEAQKSTFATALEKIGLKKSSSNDMNTTYAGEIKIGDKPKKVCVQLIHVTYYNDVAQVLDTFDFTICQFGFDGQHVTVSPVSIIDTLQKRLAIHRVTYGVSTLRRIMKYTKQGFYACSGALADLLEKVAENPTVINAQIQYID